MMKYKFSFVDHLKKCVVFYILAALITPALFTYFVYLKNRAKKSEIFSVFVSANLKDKVGFKNTIKTLLPDTLEINTYSCDINDTVFGTYYLSKGEISDLLVLPESFVNEFEVPPYLEITSLTSFDLSDAYKKNDKTYGLAVKNQNNTYLSDYIDYSDDDYYVFVNKNSVHLNNIGPDKYQTNQVEIVLSGILKK